MREDDVAAAAVEWQWSGKSHRHAESSFLGRELPMWNGRGGETCWEFNRMSQWVKVTYRRQSFGLGRIWKLDSKWLKDLTVSSSRSSAITQQFWKRPSSHLGETLFQGRHALPSISIMLALQLSRLSLKFHLYHRGLHTLVNIPLVKPLRKGLYYHHCQPERIITSLTPLSALHHFSHLFPIKSFSFFFKYISESYPRLLFSCLTA